MDTASNDIRKDRKVLKAYRSMLALSRQLYDQDEHKEVRRCLKLALEACVHAGPILEEPAILHAIGVARIVAVEIGLGINSVVASLLFDFLGEEVGDDHPGMDVIQEDTRGLIEGLARIARVDTQKSTDQGDDLRSLLIGLSEDIRVIIIKIADRLHFMRNLDRLDKKGQLRLADETFYIYAPLAERLGLYAIKMELEDLALKYTDPEAYSMVRKKLSETKAAREKFTREFIQPIREKLSKQDFDFDIKGRTKSVYSIWSKMERQEVGFEEVFDIFAIRIILKSRRASEKADCWQVYSIVTDHYQPNPDRLRDWISVPKSNGYESLHTTVVVPGGQWVEVQIRTERMNEIAEKGLAAHWKYKGGGQTSVPEDWLERVREILKNPDQYIKDETDEFKLSVYNKEVFVFTPKGDLKKFPRGATVLDFAFDVHSDVGSTCMGARVNGKNVPIRHVMSNGDRVEVITSKNQKPKQDWLNFVVTSRARSKIKLALKEEMLAEAEHGREILRRRFRNWKIEFEDRNVNKLLRHYRLKTAPDLYFRVATEKIDVLEIKDVVQGKFEPATREKEYDNLEEAVDRFITPGIKQEDFLLIDKNLDKVNYRLAKCCNPIYGDEIFGFVTVGSGISIHRVNCPNARQMISRYSYRVVKAQWSDQEAKIYLPATIRITGVDDLGIISRISDVVSKDLKVNMRSISIDSGDGMFEGTITLFVKDTGHLDVLIRQISKIKGILSVQRLEL